MKSALNLIIITMLSMISSCSNPSGESVITPGHAPFLKPPGPFQFNQVRIANGIARLQWQASPRVESYTLFQGTSASSVTTEVSTCREQTITNCIISGLNPLTTYYFKVVSKNAAGSAESNTVPALSVSTFNIASATPGNGFIDVTWANSSGATSYNVVYGTSSGAYSEIVSGVTSPYRISGLGNGVRYYLRIEAVNAFNGYVLSTSEFDTRPVGPPPKPTGVTVSATPGNITLNWNLAAGADNYRILRGTSPGALSLLVDGLSAPGYNDTSITNGVPYYYAVEAYNVYDSPRSDEVSAQSISSFVVTSVVAAPGANELTISWGSATGASSYDIRYGTNPLALNLIASNQTSPSVISGLTGSTYYFRVIALNSVGTGTSILSANQPSASPVPALFAPSGITATASPGAIVVNWNAVAGATSYEVHRSLVSGGPYSLLQSGIVGTNFTDNTSSNGTDYFYIVRAFNGFFSPNSAQVAAKPIAPFSIISSAGVDTTSIQVSWGASLGSDAYDVRWGTVSGSYSGIASGVTSPFTISGVLPATMYYIVIRGRNSTGIGTIYQTAQSSAFTTTSAPTGLVASKAPGQVSLNWTDTPGAATYTVYRGSVSGTTTLLTSGLTSSDYVDATVTDGNTYYYQVSANNGVDSPKSSEVAAKTIAAFSISSIGSAPGTLTVNWPAVLGGDAFDVEYGTTSGTYTTTLTNKTSPAVVSGLAGGTTYYFRVVARNSIGTSASMDSSEFSQTTPVGAPTGVTATVANNQITIDWSLMGGASSYKVFRGNVSGTYTEIANGITSTSHIDTSPVDGTQHFYVVRSFNGVDSLNSSEVTGKSIAAFAMTSVVATSPTTIQVTFPSTLGGDSYDVRWGTSAGTYSGLASGVGSSYNITPLSANSTYYVTVRARNAIGSTASRSAAEISVKTPTLAPASLVATSSSNQVQLNWAATTGASSYKVYRTTSSGTHVEGDLIGTIGTNSYTDSTALNGTTYFYVVRAFNGSDSAKSNEVSTRPINNFTITTATTSSSSIEVTWPAVTGADGYDIRFGTTSGSYNIGTAGTSTYTITGLAANTNYYIVVKARNAVGAGSITHSSESVRKTSTAAPTGLIATASAGQIGLSWNAVTGATHYKIYRTTSSGTHTEGDLLEDNHVGLTYLDTTVLNGVTYFYVVKAHNGSNSASSNEVSKQSISNFSLTTATAASATSVNLTWGSATGAATYDVRYGTTSGVYLGTVSGVTSPYILPGLTANTQYFISIRAQNAIGGGTSINSNELNATTSTLAPTGLVSSTVSGQANLSWTAAPGATSYKVFRHTSAGGPYTQIATGVVTNSYPDATVTNGTDYFYVVTASNGTDSVYSNEVQARAISPFTISSTSAPSTSSIIVTWGAASGATFYDVRYGTSAGSYTTTVPGVSSSYTIAGLNSGTNYFITVRARNSLSNGGVAQATEVQQTTPIGPPTGVAAVVSPGAINITWNTAGGASSYKVYRSGTSTGPYTNITSGVVSTFYNDTSAVNGLTYYYVVKAFNGADSSDSLEVSGRPIANFAASSISSPTSSSIQINWGAVTGAASYDVVWGTSSGSYLTGSATGVGSPYTINGLSANTNYYVRIIAKNSIGAGASVNSTEAVQKTATATPSGLVATATPGQIGLNWNTVTGATYYKVYRKLTSGSYTEGDLYADNVATAAYLDTTVTNGLTYYYVVKAFNGSNSAESNEVFKSSISTFSLVSVTPTSASSINVSWNAATGASAYDVKYGTTSGVALGTISSVTSPYSITSLSANTNYFVWVSANNSIGGGSSQNSNELNVTTATAAPSSLTATATTGQIALSWASAAGATNYRVLRSTVSTGPYTQIAAGITGTSYPDASITDGTHYFYVVRSFNGIESVNSNEATARSIAAFSIASVTAPTSSTIEVTWPATLGAVTYDVRWKIGAGAYTDAVGVSSPYTITGLSGNTSYDIVVKANNSVGSGSSAQTTIVTQMTPVSAPTGLVATATPGQVALTWASSAGATNYKVYRSLTSGSFGAALQTGINTTSYTDTTALNGTQYFYVVKAFNGADSLNSNEVTVMPVGIFSAFSVAVNSDSQVTVSWTGGAGAEAGKYELRYGTASNTYSTILTDQTGPVVVTGLSAGSSYYFRVTAKNSIGSGTSLNSNEIQTATAFGAPSGLTATATPGQINLSWNNVSGVTNYIVLRSTTSGSGYTQIATPVSNSYTDAGLTNGVSYYYVVQATNGTPSANSAEAGASTISAFSFVSAVTASASSVTLNWNPATGAAAYDVLYGTSTGVYGTTILGVSSPYTVTGLNSNTNYFFRIRARNAVGAGTNINSNEERNALTSPVAPSSLTTSATPGSVLLSWSAPATGATNYNIYRGTTPTGPYSTTVATAVNTLTYTDISVINGTAYYYVVRANNGSESVNSNESSIKSIASFSITSTSGASPSTISVNFPATAGGDTYDVRWGTGSGSYSGIASGVTSSYTISGLSSGTTYYIVVRANNAIGAGTSRQSNEVSQITPLSAPGSLTASSTPGQVSLSWNGVTGATNYKIFRSTAIGGPYTILPAGSAVAALTFTDSTVSNGTQYFYVVRAFNGADSSNSNEATTLPMANFSIALTTALSSTSIQVTWGAQAGASGYDIKFGTATGSYGAAVSATSSYIISGLNPSTNYYIVVVAKNSIGSGSSVDSSESIQKTAPSAPTGLIATATPGQIALSWNAVAGATSGYKVYTSSATGGPWSLISSPGLTSYTHTGLTNGVDYYYVVRANNGTDSVSSSEVAASPISSFALTSASVASDTSVTLTWGSATGSAAYDVLYGTSSGSLGTVISGVTSSYTVTGLSAASTYYFAIRARNSVGLGTSINSNELSAKTATSAPSGLSAVVTSGQIALSWTATSGATNYNVYRSTTSNSFGAAIATSVAGTSYTDSSVANGTTYYYIIRANNGSLSANSNEVIGLPMAGFSIASTSSPSTTGIQVTWIAPAGASSSDVLYSTVSGGPYTTIPGVSSPYTIPGLVSGTTYFIKVSANNSVGPGTSVETAQVSQITQLGAPVGLTAAATTGQIVLGWSASAGATNYKVLRSTTAGGPYTVLPAGSAVAALTFTDSTVSNGTQYYYVIKAFNGVDSANSSEVTGLPMANFSVATITSPSSSSIQVTWTGPAGSSAFDVIWGTTNNGPYSGSALNVSSSYTIPGLSPDTTYYVKVRAKNTIGSGSLVESVQTQIKTAMGAPVGLTASASASSIGLNWTAQPTATNFKIFRGTTSGLLSQIGTSFTNAFADSTAVNGIQYYYSVVAFNGSDSTFSSEVTVQSIGAFSLTAATTASSSSINLTWGAAAGAAAYNVKYGTSTGVYLGTVPSVSSSYLLTGLSPDTTYFISIEAVNSVGAGTNLFSNERNAKTATEIVTGLIASATPGNVSLSWNLVAGVTGYNVYRGETSGVYSQIGTNVATNSFPVNAVTNGTIYYYMVRAFNGTESANSTEVSVKPIASVTLSSVTPTSSSSLVATWAPAAGADAYDVQYGLSTGSYTVTVSDKSSSYTINGLATNTVYFVTIRARNAQGAGTNSVSNEINAKTATAAPTTLTASSTTGNVNLSWATAAGAATYNVYRGTTSGSHILIASGIGTTTYNDNSVVNGTQYYYAVKASNGSESVKSNEATALPIGTFSISSTSSTANTINVTFGSATGAATYDVRWGTTSGSYPNSATGVASTYTISGLSPNTPYFIVVRANNSVGLGGTSQTAQVSQITALGAPSGLVATGGTSQVNLVWNAVTGATSYKVLRGTVSGSYTQIASGIASTSYSDTGAVNGTVYFYVVTTFNGSDSANSNEATSRPIATSVISSVTGSSSTTLTVSWSPITGATIYDVQYGTTSGVFPNTFTNVTSPYVISGLSPGSNYYVRLVAKNVTGNGSSVNSAQVLATTNFLPVLSVISTQTMEADTTLPVNFTLSDSNNVISCAGAMSYSSSNGSLISSVVFSGTVPNCTAAITPVANQVGSTTMTFTASDGLDTSSSSFGLTVTPCVVASMLWETQPIGMAAGNLFTQAPRVSLRKADGTLCTSSIDPVTLVVTTDPSIQQDAEVTGVNTVSPSGGYAHFTGARMERAGTGFTVNAVQGLISPLASSNTFNVTALAASRLVFFQQPLTNDPSSILIPNPSVRTADTYGNFVAASGISVSASLEDNTEGAVLGGTASATTNASGIAAFPVSVNLLGSYILRATPANGWTFVDSDIFDIIVITPRTTVAVMEMMNGPILQNSGRANYPRTGTQIGTNYIDGTTTYTWQIVAQNRGNQASDIRLRIGTTQVGLITVPKSNTSVPTLYSATISNASVTPSGLWSLRAEQGEPYIYASRIIVRQTNAKRSQIYIPMMSIDNQSAVSSVTTSSSTAVIPSEINFPVYDWNKAEFDNVNGITFSFAGSATTGSACAALYNKDTNSQIGGEACVTSAIEEVALLNIPRDFMPLAAQLEVRVRAVGGGIASFYSSGIYVRLVNITKMKSIKRISPAATDVVAATEFIEQRSSSERTGYGTGAVSEMINCRARASVSGSAGFTLKEVTSTATPSVLTAGSAVAASTINYSSQSNFTNLEAGPVSTTNGKYQLQSFSRSSGTFSLSHCLYSVEVTY